MQDSSDDRLGRMNRFRNILQELVSEPLKNVVVLTFTVKILTFEYLFYLSNLARASDNKNIIIKSPKFDLNLTDLLLVDADF